ncbi:MAG: hypothetical protein U0586_14420 [Candidatus Brocadiaceae bacterium]
MSDSDAKYEWTKKGGTLSDKTAFEEFGLTQEDIIKAINDGKLQFREGSIYGNPYFRLLRSEVEKLAEGKFGKDFFRKKKAMNELKKINKELKELKSKITGLEMRKNELAQIIKA